MDLTALLDEYDLVLVVLGLAALGVVGFPRVLAGRPLSYPIIYVAAGAIMFALPLGLTSPDPTAFPSVTEHLTELGVITALMGAGLAIDRPPGLRSWATTWRLLAATMLLTIGAISLLGWWVVGLSPAAAILLGAVLAPTDPVLASDVQVSGPGGEEGEVQFALTSEAGLNDGLAFPFTNLAVLIALHGLSPTAWATEFVVVEVLYKIGIGLAGGLAVGRLLGWAIFDQRSPLPHTRDGMVAVAATLIAYGGTELVNGYGFLAVFVAAVVIRGQERRHHSYLEVMHQFSSQIERLLSAVILMLFGGAVGTGILGTIGWRGAGVAAAIILLVRPLAGMVGLWGSRIPVPQRAAISFFGIRGVGSFFYLAYATARVDFAQVEQVWALTGLVVLLSVVVHGMSATPAMGLIGRDNTQA